MSMGKNRWEHGIYDARDMPALIEERNAARKELAELKAHMVDQLERLQGDEMRLLRAELAKWKEIAEENNGEHVKLEALREAIGKLVADMRVAEKEGSGNSATERNATHFWRLRLEDLEHYEDNIRAELVALERDWRDAARMSNDPKSPSIWADCADEILRVLR